MFVCVCRVAPRATLATVLACLRARSSECLLVLYPPVCVVEPGNRIEANERVAETLEHTLHTPTSGFFRRLNAVVELKICFDDLSHKREGKTTNTTVVKVFCGDANN